MCLCTVWGCLLARMGYGSGQKLCYVWVRFGASLAQDFGISTFFLEIIGSLLL